MSVFVAVVCLKYHFIVQQFFVILSCNLSVSSCDFFRWWISICLFTTNDRLNDLIYKQLNFNSFYVTMFKIPFIGLAPSVLRIIRKLESFGFDSSIQLYCYAYAYGAFRKYFLRHVYNLSCGAWLSEKVVFCVTSLRIFQYLPNASRTGLSNIQTPGHMSQNYDAQPLQWIFSKTKVFINFYILFYFLILWFFFFLVISFSWRTFFVQFRSLRALTNKRGGGILCQFFLDI